MLACQSVADGSAGSRHPISARSHARDLMRTGGCRWSPSVAATRPTIEPESTGIDVLLSRASITRFDRCTGRTSVLPSSLDEGNR